MKKILTLFALALVGVLPQTGSALAIGGKQTVTLKADDLFIGTYSSSLSVTLTRGKAYTVWFEGGDAEKVRISSTVRGVPVSGVRPYSNDFFGWEDDFNDDYTSDDPALPTIPIGGSTTGPSARFTSFSEQGGVYMAVLQADDWGKSDPASWTYNIDLYGSSALKTTVHIAAGVKSFLPEGMKDNPRLLTMKDEEQSFPAKDETGNVTTTIESNYWFKAELEAGRRYLLRTTGGTAALPFGLTVPSAVTWESSPADYPPADGHNASVVVYPGEDGFCQFVVSATATNKVFGLEYKAVPTRDIYLHPCEDVSPDADRSFRPGRLSADIAYYDQIVDEHLSHVEVTEAGQRWVFTAAGADRKVEMRLYDSTGAIIASNNDIGDGTYNVRIVSDIKTPGDYFVGVFDPALKQTDAAACSEVVLTVKTVEPEEDDPAEAIALSPLPGTDMSNPIVDGAVSEAFDLTAARQSRTFVIGGRKNLVYLLGTTFDDAESSLRLKTEVFKRDTKGKETVIESTGSLTPGETLSFKAPENAACYIRVSVEDEKRGLDFPAFRVHSIAYTTGEEQLGILTVNTKGPDTATWSLDSESAKYAGGSSVLLAGKHTVKFTAVTGFTTPAAQTVTVAAGTNATVLVGTYVDTADPKDDYTSGSATIGGKKVTYAPTAWTLKNTESHYDRTLWEDDGADNYSITGTDGYYYDFALSKVTGDAVFSITHSDAGVIASNVTAVSKILLPKSSAKYILTVSHGNDTPTDGVYRVSGFYANVGAIKFGSTAVSAKEDAASVKLTVKRTAKDGRVRVRYATVAGTAQPGRDYYAQSGVLEWADKDNKDKTIEIRLIPDLIATYEGANRQFAVKLEAIPEDERAADEYGAAFTFNSKGEQLDTATVTLTETTKAVAGTIQVAGCENPKKPVIAIVAGETEEIALERVLGIDGIVGVSVASVKGTANKSGETDFEPISIPAITWADGVAGESEKITIVTKRTAGDFTGTKTFTLKLTALTSKKGDEIQYSKPTLAATTITVNIVNDKYVSNVTDWAKTLPKAEGVAMKEAKKDSWFRGADGEFYSVIARKFTGPSRLWWGPVDNPRLTNCFVSAKGETITMPVEDVYTNDLLQAATAAAPTVDKAVVAPGDVALKFDRLNDDEVRGIDYRVYILSTGDKIKRPGAKSAVALKLGDPETEIFPDPSGEYVTNVAYTTTNKGKYTWRVDSFFTGGTVTNTAKSAWTLNVLKDTEVTNALQVAGEKVILSRSIEQGVPVSYEITTADDAKAKVALVSGTGSLPTGLKVEQDKGTTAAPGTMKWFVRGTPTKAGSYQCAIQATYSSPTRKSPTFVLKFDVAAITATKAALPTLDKTVIAPGKVKLGFEKVEGLSYRVFFTNTTNKAKLGTYDKNLGCCPTEIYEPYEVEVGPGTNYSWQVYAFHEGAVGAMNVATNKSAQFTLTGAAADAKSTAVSGKDAYGTPFAEGTVMRLRQRLYAEFELADAGAKKVALVSGTGSLPTGLKIEQDKGTTKAPGTMKWFLRGTPTKAGSFQFLVQATYTNMVQDAKTLKWKSVDVPATTTAIAISVEAVDAPSDLSFTLTGPGRLTYTATDARIPVGQPDKTGTKVEYIASGSKTLALKDVERLHAYEYVQLPVVTPMAPTVDKAVVAAGRTDLTFYRIADDAANGIAYRAYLRNTKDTKIKLGSPETELEVKLEADHAFATTNLAENISTWEWRVDSFFTGGTVTNTVKAAWKLSTLGGEPATTHITGVDACGHAVDNEKCGQVQVIDLYQAVKAEFSVKLDSTKSNLASVKLVSGKLPDGVKISTAKPKAGDADWAFLTGVPTKAGDFEALLQLSYSGTAATKETATTALMRFHVIAAGTAIGTFNGILSEDGSALTNAFPTVGTVQFTATSAGKLTAKVTLAGTSYSFSGTGFDSVVDPATDVRKLIASLQLAKKVGTVTYTNFLDLAVLDGAVTNLTVLGSVAGSVELTMAIPDANSKGAQEDIRYIADLYRDNTKSAEYLAAFAAVEGYYTSALVIGGAEWGKPQGNSYLTFKVDAKGKCTTAGKLSDGTSVSSALIPALIGDLTKPESCELVIPVYQAKKPAVFGGLIRVRLADCGDDGELPVVDSSAFLRWASDGDATKSYDGTGWDYELIPAGGWYDTVINLQTYYLTSTFALDAGYSDDLPEELLTSGYTFVSSTMPTGEEVLLQGNTPVVAKQSLVKKVDPVTGKTTALYDWGKCINPSGVTITFKRATGVISGKFDVWTEGKDTKGNTVQKKLTGFTHEGVLLLSRDAQSPLADTVWTAGYFLTPSLKSEDTKKSLKESFQFNIMREDQGDVDWWAQDKTVNPELNLKAE